MAKKNKYVYILDIEWCYDGTVEHLINVYHCRANARAALKSDLKGILNTTDFDIFEINGCPAEIPVEIFNNDPIKFDSASLWDCNYDEYTRYVIYKKNVE